MRSYRQKTASRCDHCGDVDLSGDPYEIRGMYCDNCDIYVHYACITQYWKLLERPSRSASIERNCAQCAEGEL